MNVLLLGVAYLLLSDIIAIMNELHKLKSLFKSQDEMAKAIGVSQGVVSEWLAGNKRPSIKTCRVIESKFGFTRQQLRPDMYE